MTADAPPPRSAPPPNPSTASAAPPPVVATRAVTPAAAPVAGGSGADVWDRFLELVAMNISVAPVVEPLTLDRIEGGVAIITGAPDAIAAAKARKGAIEEAMGRAAGRPMRIELRPAGQPESAAEPPRPAHLPDTAARAEAMKNPLVRRAVELFDARVVEVEDDT